MKNVIVGQSGGPTAVINGSLYGVVKEALAHPDEIGHVYGMVHGIEGFMQDEILDLGQTLTQEDLELLKVTPAAYLGSCRYKLPEDLSSEVYPRVFGKLEALNVGYFLYIGGNDSMDTVSKLSRYGAAMGSSIRFIGVPKTIDNDLVGTDHTPGYGSAAKYVAGTVREIVLDSSVYFQKSVTIVELMGRHAGWVTAASVLARKYEGDNPVLVYLPEWDFDLERFAQDLEQAFQKTPYVVVCVSEGIRDKSGTFICEYGEGALSGTPGASQDSARLDNFGHKMLTGCGKVLENFVRDRFGVKVRSVELNVNQRCSGALLSATDLEESAQAGRQGVKAALAGENGVMVAFGRKTENPYGLECTTVKVDEVCNQEKAFPREWIAKGGNDIRQEFTDYARPLITGEVARPVKDGVAVYLYRGNC